VFIELKASQHDLKEAYDKKPPRLSDTIPDLFVPNAFLVLSNGSDHQGRHDHLGWEFFSEWKKIGSEKEAGFISLETVLRATCTKERPPPRPDRRTSWLIRTFLVLVKAARPKSPVPWVNNAIARMRNCSRSSEERGEARCFWHTQGSGQDDLDAVLHAEGYAEVSSTGPS